MITIYGASDDLIEVDGDIREEFCNPDFAGEAYIGVSTGDLIRFRLEDEGWRATIVIDATSPDIRRSAHDPDDQVTINAPATWVVATTEKPARR